MNEESLVLAQEDLFERTLADAFLANVAVLNAYTGDIDSDVDNALGYLNPRGGKIGACIICQEPMASAGNAAVAGGVLNIEFSFLVLEDPVVNKGDGGTQLRALVIARRLFGLHYLYNAIGVVGTLNARAPHAIVPVPIKGVPVAYEVALVGSEESFDPGAKVTTPVISPRTGAAPQSVTLTCGTAGAAIYYTLDGSLPHAAGASSILYPGTPVALVAAATLRAGAFKSGMIASNVNAATFT